jgi:hypothetical protein
MLSDNNIIPLIEVKNKIKIALGKEQWREIRLQKCF